MQTTTTTPPRRARGEGSYSVDPRTGTTIYRSRTLIPGQVVRGRGSNRAAARANARERAAHIRAGRPTGKPETFGETLTAWLESSRHTYSRDTWRSYRTPVNTFLLPGAIAAKPTEEVVPEDFQAIYVAALEAGYGRRSLESIKLSGSLAIQWAVANGRVAGLRPGTIWNPAIASKLPKRTPRKGSRSAPDFDSVTAFLGVADTEPNGAVFRIMAECALRPSEAAGLRWSDVDLEEGVIRLRGACRYDEGLGEYRFDPGMKNGEGGERDIEIGPELVALLHAQRARIRSLQLASRWESDRWAGDLVFRKAKDGTAADSVHLGHAQRAILKRLPEVTRFVNYQLRHHLPTRLAAVGVPAEVAADLLGIDVRTLRRYYRDAPKRPVPYDVIRTALNG